MATCPKCGTSLLPNAAQCPRCGAGGAAAARGPLLVAMALGMSVALAGAGAAFFLLGSGAGVEQEAPAEEPAAPPPSVEAAAAGGAKRQLEDALLRARKQISEAKAKAPDEETRRRLDEAMNLAEQLLTAAEQQRPPAVAESPEGEAGACESALVSRVVRQHVRTIQECYERGLRTRPGLKGKLVVGFTIGTDGRVRSAEMAEDTIGEAAVSACALAAVKRWAFPATSRECTVKFPFHFSSDD